MSTPERVAATVLRVLDRPRDRSQVGPANGLMRAGFTFLPGVYDALVGPLFGVAALDRTTPLAPAPGQRPGPGGRRSHPARAASPALWWPWDGTWRPSSAGGDAVTSEDYDAVVIGAGPNGLVAANRLADAGWSVLVLEAQPRVGGAVASDREVHPAFVHDTFSSFYPLAAASPTLASFGLERHGLTWRHAPAVLGHPLPDGSWALLHRDRHVTAALLDAAARRRRGRLAASCARCGTGSATRWSPGLLTPFPPVRVLPAAVRGLPRRRRPRRRQDAC